MDAREIALLEKYAPKDQELKELWENHALYEKQLEKLESKAYRTPAEEQQRREIKKQKLDGKTKLVALLDQYAKQEG